MLCFFNGHCWPVMATHYLAGRDDGGFQFGDSGNEMGTENGSWTDRVGIRLSGYGDGTVTALEVFGTFECRPGANAWRY